MATCISTSTLGTVPDTYLYALSKAGSAYATIGSDDSIRIFDGSLKLLHQVVSAHTGISCLTSFGRGFATAARDGKARYWDVRSKQIGIEVSEPKGNGFSSILCQDRIIALGTESTKEGLGEVSVWLYDTRNSSTPYRHYAESHTDTITQLAFHPSQPNLLMSGSTDGLVSIFDVNQQDEEDALQQVLNPRSAVHCAGFFNPREAYVATMDEQLSIYSIGDSGNAAASSVLEIGDVREKLHCMYIVNIINSSTPIMTFGHNVEQKLGIVQLDASNSYSFGAMIDLPGAHGEEVVRDLLLLEPEAKAISCGEDGKVRVWDLSAGGRNSSDAMITD